MFAYGSLQFQLYCSVAFDDSRIAPSHEPVNATRRGTCAYLADAILPFCAGFGDENQAWCHNVACTGGDTQLGESHDVSAIWTTEQSAPRHSPVEHNSQEVTI